jgi:hypothetical protein
MSTIFPHSSAQLAADESLISSFLARPRNTPSARNARARDAAEAEAGGAAATGAARMRGVFARLDALAQEPARQLAFERMVIEAKVASVLEREGGGGGGDDEGAAGADVLERLLEAARDNDAELARRLGAAGAREVLAAIAAPDVRDALRLSVVSEEEAAALRASTLEEYYAGVGSGGGTSRGAARADALAEERAARLWRRRLWKLTVPVRISAKLRWATAHDDVDRFGHRTLVNELNRADARDGLSYYQASALKYGHARGRRGSTGVAGAWEDVYSGPAAAARVAAFDAGAKLSYRAPPAPAPEPLPPPPPPPPSAGRASAGRAAPRSPAVDVMLGALADAMRPPAARGHVTAAAASARKAAAAAESDALDAELEDAFAALEVALESEARRA